MRLGQLSLMGLLAVGSLLTTGSAFADPVYGTANITGTVSVSENSILFSNPFYAPPSVPVPPTETGSFAGLAYGTVNTPLTGGPITGSVDYKNFMTFYAGSNVIDFDLTYIAPGIGTAAPCGTNAIGQPCTIANSPFTLTQDSLNPDSVDIKLLLQGVSYYDNDKGTTSPTVGLFTTQIAGDLTVPDSKVSDILAYLNAGHTLDGITYSATFSASPTPEPATWLLMSVGLLGAGFIARRKAQAAKLNS